MEKWLEKYEDGGKIKLDKVRGGLSPYTSSLSDAPKEEVKAHLLFPFPTPNDELLNNTRQNSDSAQYVAGYRSPKTIQEVWPEILTINSPFEGGYYTQMYDAKRLKELPGEFDFIRNRVKPKKKSGGELIKLDQLTTFDNYNKPQSSKWLDKYK